MPVPNLIFNPPYDIHLLRGQSINLSNLLNIGDMSAGSYIALKPTISVLYSATFKGTTVANVYSGLNISLDTQSGMLTALPAAPAHETRNFIVIATARDSNDTYTSDNPPPETRIRIHIHHSITEAWLSPHMLTVVQGVNGFKFSIRARFDDDVEAEIGEIYNYNTKSPVNYGFNPPYAITWASPTANLINPANGEITPGAGLATGMPPHIVTANIQCLGQNVNAAGTVFIGTQLTVPNTSANLITTGNCPGFAAIDDVPNILYIPDGFAIEDRIMFDRIMDDYISDLTKGKISSPFDLLAGSVNYWKAFLTSGGSQDRGATYRREMYLKEKDGNIVATTLQLPVKPTETDSSKWDFSNLFYHVGVPVRSQKNTADNDLKDEWKLTSALSGALITAISPDAILNWKKTAERRLPEEIDTVLGMQINDYSSAAQDDSHNMIDFNPRRMIRDKLDTFLAVLKDDAGNLIGNRFVKGNAQGKDYDNIVIISAAAGGRAQNITGGFFLNINSEEWEFKVSGTMSDFRTHMVTENDLEKLANGKKSTLTHELGHSFALGDEYGEQPPVSSWVNKFINAQAVTSWGYAVMPAALTASMDEWSNLQALNDLLSPNPNIPGTGMIDANKIKWRYHRIKKCGVAVSSPVPDGTRYNISVKPGQAAAFTAGDKVFLRKRKSQSYRLQNTVVGGGSANILSVSAPADSLIPLVLSVTLVNNANDHVEATDGTTTYNFTVVRGRASAFNVGNTVRVTKSFIGEHIASVKRTLSASPVTTSDLVTLLISNEFEVKLIVGATNQVVIESTTPGVSLSSEFLTLAPGEVMIIYSPVPAPASVISDSYKYAEMISKKVLDHLIAHPEPFNAVQDPGNANLLTEIIDKSPVQNSSIPSSLVPCCSSRKKEIVGFYSCGSLYHGHIYHPTGHCFMRSAIHNGDYDEFCAVCKYTLVNIINPAKHPELDAIYDGRKIYPT